MHRIKKLAAGVVVAGLAFGASVPAAEAAPKRAASSKSVKAKPVKVAKVSAAAKRLESARRTALQAVGQVDRKLVHFSAPERLAGLDASYAGTLLASVAADRAQLATLRTAVLGATTLGEVSALTRQVRAVRAEVYAIAVGVLTEAASLQAEVDALRVEAGETPSEEVVAGLDAADAALVSAVDKALAASAFGDKRAVASAEDDLELAAAAVAAVVEALAPVEEPVV